MAQYNSKHTGSQIDSAVARALSGGTIDQGIAKIATESTDYPGCYYRMVDGSQEWINPPMMLGVEYRTTERYLGKPVYALCANFGANIDGSSIYFGENVLRIVRGQAYSGQGDGLYPWYQGKTINNWTAFFDFTVGTDTSDNIRKIKVTCRANSSASNTYSATYVVLHYTKTTD